MKVFLTKYRKLTPNSFRPAKKPNVIKRSMIMPTVAIHFSVIFRSFVVPYVGYLYAVSPVSRCLGAVSSCNVLNKWIMLSDILMCQMRNAKRKCCTFVIAMNGSNIVSLSAQYRTNYQQTIHGSRNRLWSCDTTQDYMSRLLDRRGRGNRFLSRTIWVEFFSYLWSCLNGSSPGEKSQ